MAKTRAIALLESKKIPHRVEGFDAVEFSAEEVAEKLNRPLPSVFKTLVARTSEKQVVMAVVPGDKNLNLNLLAKALKAKRADLVNLKELEPLTGYQKGGCSPIIAKRVFPVVIDESVRTHADVAVSAGLRGLQVIIAPEDLIAVCNATVTSLWSAPVPGASE